MDDAIFEKPEYPRRVAAVGEIPAELARELGLPPGALEATLALYNEHGARGEDPLFGEAREYVVPLAKPPFGAFDCTTATSLYAAFTLGGLATDTDGGGSQRSARASIEIAPRPLARGAHGVDRLTRPGMSRERAPSRCADMPHTRSALVRIPRYMSCG